MTLSELRYIVAVARERHFGRAARACFVSQPTLSLAVKKLEGELDTLIFERHQHKVTITSIGKLIVEQAQQILRQAHEIKQLAEYGKDPLQGTLNLGIIYTIGPFLLPRLIPLINKTAPRLSLIIEEDFTDNLHQKLKSGQLDVIILSLPFADPAFRITTLYREPFTVALPKDHRLSKKKKIKIDDLMEDTLLLLKAGNCFRDQILSICPTCPVNRFSADKIQKTLESSSIETIRQMVASGVGVTILPASAAEHYDEMQGLLTYRPFQKPVPYRDIALACRKSFPRTEEIALLENTIEQCKMTWADFSKNKQPTSKQ